jgi:hypothetical protein
MARDGYLDGALPPYRLVLLDSELDAVSDALEYYLGYIQEKVQTGSPEEGHVEAYVFIRMIKGRLEKMRDPQDET